MIIGVDHGYSAMKTAHICFPSGIVRYECILRSPADSDAFQSGRCAEHNGRPESPIIVS